MSRESVPKQGTSQSVSLSFWLVLQVIQKMANILFFMQITNQILRLDFNFWNLKPFENVLKQYQFLVIPKRRILIRFQALKLVCSESLLIMDYFLRIISICYYQRGRFEFQWSAASTRDSTLWVEFHWILRKEWSHQMSAILQYNWNFRSLPNSNLTFCLCVHSFCCLKIIDFWSSQFIETGPETNLLFITFQTNTHFEFCTK